MSKSRNLNQHLLEGLRRQYDFLKGWNAYVHAPGDIEVFLRVQRGGIIQDIYNLEYGSNGDPSYTKGTTRIWTSNGSNLLVHNLKEGVTNLTDIIVADTTYIIVEQQFRLQLIRDDGWEVSYTIYKDVNGLAIVEQEYAIAEKLREELES